MITALYRVYSHRVLFNLENTEFYIMFCSVSWQIWQTSKLNVSENGCFFGLSSQELMLKCRPCNTMAPWMMSSWASCQIGKIAGAHAPVMPGTFSPPPRVSDPDMHHGTCVTHVPWCMPGSLTSGFIWSRRWRKTFPAFPAHAQPAILRIW